MKAERHGLLILLPDLVRSRRTWARLVRRLDHLRLEVVAATPARLRRDQYTALYAGSVVKQHNRGRPSASWLGQQLTSLDMSIPLMVRTPLPVDLSTLLTEWKGPSGYGTRNSGDLREVSPTSDRCASLFHCSDSPAEMRKDAIVFYGLELVTQILSGWHPRPIRLENILALRFFLPADDEPHPYDLVLRSLVRGIALFCFDALIGVSSWATDGRMEEAMEERDKLASMCGRAALEELPETLCRMLAKLPPKGSLITGPDIVVHRRRALLTALHQLCETANWGPELAARVIHEFESNELHLDPWEQHRLTTALTFYSHNAR